MEKIIICQSEDKNQIEKRDEFNEIDKKWVK